MSWCRQTTSHYPSQCWPTLMSLYGAIRPPWVMTIHLKGIWTKRTLNYLWSIQHIREKMACHDDVIKRKYFLRNCPFVGRIHRSPVNSPQKASDTELWFFFFDLRLNKRLSKQSWGWWFETLPRPLWRHNNAPAEGQALLCAMMSQRWPN